MNTTRHRPMIWLSRPACGALLALLLAGCHGASSDSSSAAASKADQSATPAYSVIRRGHPPLSTMVTAAGQIEIVDRDDNKVVLKKTKIAPNTLITMNTGSLTLNMTEVSTGPFNRQHTYEFRLYR